MIQPKLESMGSRLRTKAGSSSSLLPNKFLYKNTLKGTVNGGNGFLHINNSSTLVILI